MSIGQSERTTQNRVIKLFSDELGYQYLGDWQDRSGNSNIEEDLLTDYLSQNGYTKQQIGKAIHALRAEADNHHRGLYGNNQAVYSLLYHGVPVKTDLSKPNETVQIINWTEPEKNHFAIAEEVTLRGLNTRRPDIVLYINGIAIAVLELKNSRIAVSEGIRQNLSNQRAEFNEWFFSTVQLVFAGNDSEGLKYGTIKTEEKYYLSWKENEEDNAGYKLDKYLKKMCNKERIMELMHGFVLFDAGQKKVPRVHQYFGIKAAQQHVKDRKGGIIWHTQGSGKSIVMVLLAKWILKINPHARVVIITDRIELDKQITNVFSDGGEKIKRTTSGRDLMTQLGKAEPRLICSLIHKFRKQDIENFDEYIKELESMPSKTVGELFVFVDECHRTQSGKLHRVMKAQMPSAVFIGFTGTPLLKKDKQTSQEVFGDYIHTYKFSEAVADGVVLDLIYEARDIDQHLGSEDKIDAWFEAKTRGLNDWKKDELKKKWGTMQKVLSSRSRMDRIVSDIVFDYTVKPRLSNGRGNAMLVVSSIYEACKYFALFNQTGFKKQCAIITSYDPQVKDITKEDTGENTETEKEFIYNTYTELLNDVNYAPGRTKTETYEDNAKELFKKQPANMKLLIVVDKLLTGFDAPCCTYLYIDKSMQDHALFQAICRTNRIDSDDKDFGYIVDYKDLFKMVEKAVAVYSSELDISTDGTDPQIMMQNRLTKGRERLEAAMEALALICEPVEPPKSTLECQHYFCGNSEIAENLKEREFLRVALYKGVVSFIRAWANIKDESEAAGYTLRDKLRIEQELDRYIKLRECIRLTSGESIDLKAYEADMRHLIDTFIEAAESRVISPFENTPLLELFAIYDINDMLKKFPDGIKDSPEACAEVIENNVRRIIVKEHLADPAYYEHMSVLLDEIIKSRKEKAIEYEEYLKQIKELATQVQKGHEDSMPKELDTPGKRALYNNLDNDKDLAIIIDALVKHVRPDDWRGDPRRELVIKQALYGHFESIDEVERIFPIIKNQQEY